MTEEGIKRIIGKPYKGCKDENQVMSALIVFICGCIGIVLVSIIITKALIGGAM